MKTIIVAALAAAGIAVGFAPPAQAGTGICGALDRAGTVSAGVATLELIAASSDNPDRDAYTIANQVIDTCPEHLPVLSAFVQKWG